MSTPTRDTVNAAALAAQAALKAAANTKFIAEADIVIAEMRDKGDFSVRLPVLKPASMLDIATYYRNLGYGACYDECSYWNHAQWPGVWSYPYSAWYPEYHVCNCKQVCSITLSWR